MSVEPIGLVVVLLGGIALLRGPAFAATTFVLLTLLGAAGAVLLGGSGTIQPSHLMLGFLVPACLGRLDWTAARRSLRCPGPGFWLAGFTLVALPGAAVLPRVLARSTSINAVGVTDYGPSLLSVPLGPTSGNLTQSIYLVADLLCFLVCLALAGRTDGARTLARALAGYCALNIGFALVDVATFWTSTGFLLAPIRNADYQMHVETVSTGMKRIVGSFVEASSFAGATIGAFAYTARLALAGIRPRLYGTLALASFALLLLSTSSTAYVAGAGLLAVLYAGVVRRALGTLGSGVDLAVLVLAPLAAVALTAAVVLLPQASEAVGNTLDTVLFDKADSQSGIDRASWNTAALGNVRDTYGLGTGLGSVRASSFPVAVLANTGVPGAMLMAAFLLTVLFGRPDGGTPSRHALRSAARTACVAQLFGAGVAGTMVDLGLPFYIYAALACAPALDGARRAARASGIEGGRRALPGSSPVAAWRGAPRRAV